MNVFDPISIRGKKSRNRIIMSPMCMYSSTNGSPNEFHLVHYASRAMGGAGIIMVEATAIEPIGRISPKDLCFNDPSQIDEFRNIANSIEKYGSLSGIQLAHAGRKAGTYPPGEGRGKMPIDLGGWINIAPSPIPYRSNWERPIEMNYDQIRKVEEGFGKSAKLAVEAGFDIVEIHAAHGYLIHEFLSPISNKRTDKYGGNIDNRMRFLLEIVNEVRGSIEEDMPLFVRISGLDFVEGGWGIDDSAILSRELKKVGVDLIDCSSGGIIPGIKLPEYDAYNLPISTAIKSKSDILTSVVGNIKSLETMNFIIENNQADMISLGRLLLRDPYWPSRNAINYSKKFYPKQYEDGFDDI